MARDILQSLAKCDQNMAELHDLADVQAVRFQPLRRIAESQTEDDFWQALGDLGPVELASLRSLLSLGYRFVSEVSTARLLSEMVERDGPAC